MQAPYSELKLKLELVQAALLGAEVEPIELACREFGACLVQICSNPKVWQQLTREEVANLDQQFRTLRQALVQRAASNDRLVALLVPETAFSGYGGKSPFGAPARAPLGTSFQA